MIDFTSFAAGIAFGSIVAYYSIWVDQRNKRIAKLIEDYVHGIHVDESEQP